MLPPVNQLRCLPDVTVQVVTKETDVIPALTVTMVKHVVSMRLITDVLLFPPEVLRTVIFLMNSNPNLKISIHVYICLHRNILNDSTIEKMLSCHLWCFEAKFSKITCGRVLQLIRRFHFLQSQQQSSPKNENNLLFQENL